MWVSAYIHMWASTCTYRHIHIGFLLYTHIGIYGCPSLCAYMAPYRQPPPSSLRVTWCWAEKKAGCSPHIGELVEVWPWKKRHKCTYKEFLSNCLLRKRKESGERASKQEKGGKMEREKASLTLLESKPDPIASLRLSQTPEREGERYGWHL